MKKQGFVLTMQYNDEYFLPIWIRHYEKYFSHQSMYVIDHGSDHNFLPPTVNRIYVPRTKGFDELDRLSMIQGMVFSLMKCYDYGVFCDSDELILLDNFSPEAMLHKQSLFCYGFDLFKVSVDDTVKIYGIFNHAMCKPLVFNHDYPGWSTGFHGVKLTEPPQISMVMGHLKYINQEAYERNFRNRLLAYESMSAAEKQKGIAQQWNDPLHFSKMYNYVQQVIGNVPLCNDLSKIPLEWEYEVNGCTIFKPPPMPFVMDLTDQFPGLALA